MLHEARNVLVQFSQDCELIRLVLKIIDFLEPNIIPSQVFTCYDICSGNGYFSDATWCFVEAILCSIMETKDGIVSSQMSGGIPLSYKEMAESCRSSQEQYSQYW